MRMDTSAAEDLARSTTLPRPAYVGYTVARYNRAIRRLVALKVHYAAWMIGLTVLSAALLASDRAPGTSAGAYLQYLTIAWLLPLPLLVWVTFAYFSWFRADRFVLGVPTTVAADHELPTVFFQVTSTGTNVDTVLNTVRSTLYWTRRCPDLPYKTVVWATIEEWGYQPNRAQFDALGRDGVVVSVVPSSYQTPKGTTRKGRALQFTVSERRRRGYDLARSWVYHQDDETAVGEDTVRGIGEFVQRYGHQKALGLGIILYPQDGDYRPSQIQEFGRSKDDIRTIYTITSPKNKMSGFHGSHFLVRADVEDETGWDAGPNMLSEDLIFENAVRRDHGPIFHILKGFAYEKAAFSLRDQLKQRRRWVQGFARAIRRQPFSAGRRAVMAYSMAVWLAAVFSLAAIVTSWVFDFTTLVPYAGGVAGFVWVTMITGYHKGFVLHREYMPRRTISRTRVVLNGLVGGLADGLAPWYGLFTKRKRTFEVIQKDRVRVPVPLPLPGPVAGRPFARLNR
jgi:egghead protein (zeste-white 4 protein)